MRSLLFNLYFYAITALMAATSYAMSLGAGPKTMRGCLHVWTRLALFGVRVILGGRVVISGRENLPADGPALIISKHQSELDAIVLLNQFPEIGAIAMQELGNYPFVGRIIRKIEYILVPVSGPPAGRTKAVIDGAARIHAQGRPILIYPEGTLMSLGASERYRSGAWRIYDSLGVAAQPVAMSVGVIWPRREWRKSSGATGGAQFLAPIPPGLPMDEFMARLENEIETATMAMIEAHASPEIVAQARDRKRRGVANEGETD